MRVQPLRGSDLLLTHDSGEARQRKLQPVGRWRRWQKQSSLARPRLNWLGRERHLYNWRHRRMRAQLQLQQLEEEPRVEHGQGKTERALKSGDRVTR